MQFTNPAATGLAALCLAGVGTAALGLGPAGPAADKAGVGEPLPQRELSEFSNPDVTSLDDFYGQTVLLEFFAHW